eukprot:scaffold248417_cov67-Attheya_sp.AAC.8
MIGPPTPAVTAHQQRKKQIGKHTAREIEKWKGTSRPRPRKGVVTDPTLHKHHVMADLRKHNISMIPATIGPWGDMGPMLELTLYGTFPSDVNYMSILAGHRTLVPETTEAIMTARSRAKVQALLPSAEASWRLNHGRRWFGPTYQDTMSPLPSTRKNIGLMLTRELANQVAVGATRATTSFISHEPPKRSRGHTYVARAPGGLPLTSDRDCYGAPVGAHTTPPTAQSFHLSTAPLELDSLKDLSGESV